MLAEDDIDLPPTPPSVAEAAKTAIEQLVPSKSGVIYEASYKRFMEYCKDENIKKYSENALLGYFIKLKNVNKMKSSSMWGHYSMIRSIQTDVYLNLEQDGEEIWIQIMDDTNVELLAENDAMSMEGLLKFVNGDREKLDDEQNTQENSEEVTMKKTKLISSKEISKRRCNACGSYFRFLARHLESHGPYNCTDCLLHFTSEDLYNKHNLESHNKDKESYKCDICELGLSSVTKLAIHKFKHTGTYSCPLCNFTVKGKHKHSLINHIRRHEGQYSVFCEVCGQGFIEKHILATHMEIHEGIPKYECEFCKKKFTVRRYLDVHKSLNHKKELYGIEETFQCEICGRRFTFEKSLIRHLSAIHKIGEDRTVECQVCMKKIANNHNLKKHMRVHTGEKRFCCDTCGRAFAEKKYLQKHQAAHNRENEKKRKMQQFVSEKIKIENVSNLQDDNLQQYLVCKEESDEDNPDALGAKFIYFTY